MTWTIHLTPNDQDSLGALVACVEDEVAREIRDTVLSIIARPVFERAEQAHKMTTALESAIGGLAGIVNEEVARERVKRPKPAAKPKPRGRRVCQATARTEGDLLNILRLAKEHGAPAMDLNALEASVNARRVERGDQTVCTNSVRRAARKLAEAGKLQVAAEPRGQAVHRQVYWLADKRETVIIAGEGVRA